MRTFADLADLVAALGMAPRVERWRAPMSLADEDPDTVTAFIRTRLCLPPDRDEDVVRAIERHGLPSQREAAAVWWDTSTPG